MATDIYHAFGALTQYFGNLLALVTLAAQRWFTAHGRHAMLCPN
jgi:hypothetical protein